MILFHAFHLRWVLLCVLYGLIGSGSLVYAAEHAPVRSVKTQEKWIALTFDDGPKPDITPAMLALFKQEGVQATFFVLGEQVKQYPELAARVIAEGHEIGNHSMTHLNLSQQTKDMIAQEIEGAQQLLQDTINYTPKLFRAPYLQYNADVYECLNRNGLQAVNLSIICADWKPNTTARTVVELATKTPHPGGIILLHELPVTLEALPGIIAYYREAGYSFVTVSRLLEERH